MIQIRTEELNDHAPVLVPTASTLATIGITVYQILIVQTILERLELDVRAVVLKRILLRQHLIMSLVVLLLLGLNNYGMKAATLQFVHVEMRKAEIVHNLTFVYGQTIIVMERLVYQNVKEQRLRIVLVGTLEVIIR